MDGVNEHLRCKVKSSLKSEKQNTTGVIDLFFSSHLPTFKELRLKKWSLEKWGSPEGLVPFQVRVLSDLPGVLFSVGLWW